MKPRPGAVVQLLAETGHFAPQPVVQISSSQRPVADYQKEGLPGLFGELEIALEGGRDPIDKSLFVMVMDISGDVSFTFEN